MSDYHFMKAGSSNFEEDNLNHELINLIKKNNDWIEPSI